MIIFTEVIITTVFLLFPILLYFFYVEYKRNIKLIEKDIICKLCIFVCLFFVILLVKYFNDVNYIIFCTIPVLYCFILKKNNIIIVMCILLGMVLYFEINMQIYLIILLNLLYIVIYVIYSIKSIHERYLILFFSFITLSIFSIYYFTNCMIINGLTTKYFIIFMILYCIVNYVVFKIIEKAKEVINLYMTLKEFEKEKQIKNSLFKITHEIKNPIAVCKGYLDMFDVNNKEKSLKYVNIISQEISRTLNLLNDFMQFTKININKSLVDFNALFEDINQAMLPLLRSNNIKYSYKVEKELFINLDYERIKQVVINLLKNAKESIVSEGVIKVISYIDESKLTVIIKDNGIGMSKSDMEKMLIPFYTTKKDGSGLGVSLSREIIEAHNGSISYSSIVNKGTIVKMILPLK